MSLPVPIPTLLFVYGVMLCCYLCAIGPGTSGKTVGIVAGTLLMAVLRFSVPGHGFSWPGSYEALVHTGCGVLLCLACQKNWLALKALLIVVVFEGIMFLAR